MPAIFTHIQFGKEVLANLPISYQTLAEKHAQAFYLGTQGPDLLFYHKPLQKENNPTRKKGWNLHAEAPEPFFLNAAKFLLQQTENFDKQDGFSPCTAQAAYVMGFLCHFTLDSLCHPYIDEHSTNDLSHGKIESELDKYQFRKIGKRIRGFNAATLFFPCEESKRAAADILQVTESEAETALRYMRTINALFSNRCGVVHGFCHSILKLARLEEKFGDMFIHKKDDTRCEKLLDVLHEKFNAAIPQACTLITDFFENIEGHVRDESLNDNFFHRNYSGI